MPRPAILFIALVAGFAVAGIVDAAKPPPDLTNTLWDGQSFEKYSVQKLGKTTDSHSFVLSLGAPGQWSSSSSSGLDTAGTYQQSGTKAVFSHSFGSREALRNALENALQEAVDDEGLGFDVSLSIVSIASKAKVKAKNGVPLLMKYKTKVAITATGGIYAVKGKYQEKGLALPR